jgi:hypothetical protein
VTINTTRKMAHIITKTPPLNRQITPSFFIGLRLEAHNIGTGMDRRYKSVATFMER